jgi:lysozyme family protein
MSWASRLWHWLCGFRRTAGSETDRCDSLADDPHGLRLHASGEAIGSRRPGWREVPVVSPAFLRALEKTLEFEGGYVNHPADSGGPTNYGITQRTYDVWRLGVGKPKQPVELVGDIEIQAIYFANYWTPCKCEDLPEPLSHAVFDMAVNAGVWNAKITLQQAVRVRQDGVIGPLTIAAVKEKPDALLAFLKGRAGYVSEIIHARPSQAAFLHGWINRLLDQAWKGAR